MGYAMEQAARRTERRLACDPKRLHVFADVGFGGRRVWMYALVEDELANAVHVPNFFQPVYSDPALPGSIPEMSTGDVIHLTGPDGGATRCVINHDGLVRLKAMQ